MASSAYHHKQDTTALISLRYEGRSERAGQKLRRSTCASCNLPFNERRPPVLLKSGDRLHVDCYFLLQKMPRQRAS